ncbi:Alkaline phosphatase [Crocosphaera watsonii WH 0005]|uniref:Alkaline phosphatase n=1 Tax=Crocosphaera watsonii WH 0005 TaxID=423472 RepID=T2IPJ1_CROWT|nr:Alkaline phosphatase [Crocosphaera watsonii WH 0005]
MNADAGIIDVLDISDPSNPVIATTDGGEEIRIDVSDATLPDGFVVGGINSVAVNNGVIAIAVEADATGDNGLAVFYTVGTTDTAPVFLNAVEVGALPDMVTFTPDGTKVLTANEGEPNDDYSVDPEGSISIIDISGGVETVTQANVTTAGFTQFNDQIESLRGQGVRIFGPGATVAQDLEPEYIAVSSDSQTAYVSLQENNALAVVDLTSNEVTAILPLGFKDQNLSPTVTTTFFEEEELPVIGTSQAQGEILLGGFSGLYFEGVNLG